MLVAPRALAHVVYRTRRFDEMLTWYSTVFGATVQHQNPAMGFLTYDDEHHRFAFLDLSVVDPQGADAEAPSSTPRNGWRQCAQALRSRTSACARCMNRCRRFGAPSARCSEAACPARRPIRMGGAE